MDRGSRANIVLPQAGGAGAGPKLPLTAMCPPSQHKPDTIRLTGKKASVGTRTSGLVQFWFDISCVQILNGLWSVSSTMSSPVNGLISVCMKNLENRPFGNRLTLIRPVISTRINSDIKWVSFAGPRSGKGPPINFIHQ